MWRTLVNYGRRNSPVMAAGMSFFAMLSLIPMTILAVSLLGYFLGSSEEAQQFVSKTLWENFPTSAEEILEQINAIITTPKRKIVNSLSLLGLMWSGMRFFNILQRVLNDVWIGATQRRFLRGRLAAFFTFAIAGFLFWLSFIFTSYMTAVRELDITVGMITLSTSPGMWFIMEYAIAFGASTLMIFLVYLIVPHAAVSLRSALIGAVFAAVFLQLSRWGFGLIMVKFDVYGQVYGPLAGFIMFMSWLYLSMTIFLLGAELGSHCQELVFRTKPEAEEE